MSATPQSLSFFKRLFSPISSRRPLFGIHISGDSIRSVEFIPSSGGNVVGTHNALELPVGTIKDGRLERPSELLAALTVIRAGRRSFPVSVALPEDQARFFSFPVPSLLPEKVREYVAAHIEESTDLSPETAVFDYTPIPLRGEGKGKAKYEVSVVAYPRDVVNEYRNLFQASGMTLRAFEAEAVSVSRAIAPKQSVSMTVFFGELGAWISINDCGAVVYSKNLSVTGSKMTKALEHRFSLSADEAYAMKANSTFSGKSEFKDFVSAISKDAAALAGEINHEYVRWGKHMPDLPIEEVLLCGEGAALSGLAEYLSLTLRLNITTADAWKYADLKTNYVPPIVRKDSLGYVGAIGAALAER